MKRFGGAGVSPARLVRSAHPTLRRRDACATNAKELFQAVRDEQYVCHFSVKRYFDYLLFF
jgi:hypothetical protein